MPRVEVARGQSPSEHTFSPSSLQSPALPLVRTPTLTQNCNPKGGGEECGACYCMFIINVYGVIVQHTYHGVKSTLRIPGYIGQGTIQIVNFIFSFRSNGAGRVCGGSGLREGTHCHYNVCVYVCVLFCSQTEPDSRDHLHLLPHGLRSHQLCLFRGLSCPVPRSGPLSSLLIKSGLFFGGGRRERLTKCSLKFFPNPQATCSPPL